MSMTNRSAELGATRISRSVLWDEEIYEREMRTVFRKSWLFLAHETEIPSPGDYVTRQMGEESVIVARDERGEIRVFLNSCPHRGTQLCRAELGNSSHFRCSYHGWTFSNAGQLRGVPRQKELMPPDFDKAANALLEPPHVGIFQGLVFATWDPEAKPLAEDFEHLGFYLDAMLGGTDEGYEVVGPPARRTIRVNWKLGAENFAGDSYHLATTHESAVKAGLLGPPEEFYKFDTISTHVNAGNGHTARIEQFPYRPEPPAFLGYPDNIAEEFMRNLSPEQIQLKSGTFIVHGNIFPSLSYMDTLVPKVSDGGPPIAYVWLGLWQPLGPHKLEYLNWHLVPKGAPEDWKRRAHFALVNTVGHGGLIAADDVEIFESMVAANRGEVARSQDSNYELGSHFKRESLTSYPGERVYSGVSEANQRYFYEHWQDLMSEEES
jgi:PAH dioxygenase large subunit